MLSLYQFATKIPSLIIFPYAAITLFVISYFIHHKLQLKRTIQALSNSTDDDDVNKVKTLRFKSMVVNIILILSILEIVVNISFEGSLIIRYDLSTYDPSPVAVSNSCIIMDKDLLGLVDFQFLGVTLIYNITIITGSLILPIISLFFKILRKIYLNHPYLRHIKLHLAYIVLKFLLLTILYCLMQTWYLVQLLFLPITLIEVYIYISSSRRLYSLLKGLRDQAYVHSEKYVYREKVRIVNQFFYAQIVSIFGLFMLLIVTVNCFISVPLLICIYNPCFLSYISFGFIPNFSISQQVREICYTLHRYNFVIQLTCLGVLEIMAVLIQLAVFIDIIIHLLRRRKKFNNINKRIAQTVMKRYRKSFYHLYA